MTKFALLSYSTNNLGDEIQSIAAQQYLPRTDLLIDRDDWTTNSTVTGDMFKIIFNGWFTRNPGNWPPPAFLSPCVVSMHITSERFRPAALIAPSVVLLEGANLEYLKRHQPAGGRDLWTTSLLKQHGVESYFSGCVTLTLGAEAERQRGDYICAVDLAAPTYHLLTDRVRSPVLRLQHRDANGGTFEERCAKANLLLDLYAHAKCVVTTRLHCALPCLALETPVLFINEVPDQYRLSGLIDLMQSCSVDAFADGLTDFDLEEPAPNSGLHIPLRKALIARLESFTGAPIRPYRPRAPADIKCRSTTTTTWKSR